MRVFNKLNSTKKTEKLGIQHRNSVFVVESNDDVGKKINFVSNNGSEVDFCSKTRPIFNRRAPAIKGYAVLIDGPWHATIMERFLESRQNANTQRREAEHEKRTI